MKRKRILFELILCLLMATAFISCSGSGNSSEVKDDENDFSTENMTLDKVNIDKTVCKAGHSTTINVTITSDNPTVAKNVPVSVIFLKKSDNKSSSTETLEEQYYAGTYLIDEVTQGTTSYNLNIIVPDIGTDYSSFTILGMFYDNLCKMYEGKDNISDDDESAKIEDGVITESEEIKLDPSLVDQPDLMIENARLSSDIMVLFLKSIENFGTNDPISISYDVEVLAKDISDAKIKFYLKTLDGKKSWLMNINKDETLQTEISLNSLNKYAKQTMNTLLSFPNDAFMEILNTAMNGTEIQYPFYIQAVVTSASEPAEFVSTNNSAIANFYINPDNSILPEITPKKIFGCSYNKYYGNSFFGAGYNFSAYTGIDKDKIYSDNVAALPIHIRYICDANFLELTLTYRTYFKGKTTDGQDPGLFVICRGLDPFKLVNLPPKIVMHNYFTYEGSLIEEWKTEGVLPIFDTIVPNIKEASSNSSGILSFTMFKDDIVPKSGQSYISRSFSFNIPLTIGPIPSQVKFSMSMGIGVSAFVGLQKTQVAIGFVPYFYVDAKAYACFGLRKVISAGAQGELNLIQGEVRNVAWLGWELQKPDVNNNVFLTANANVYSGVSINYLRGKVYGFVTYPWPKFKKKHGVRYFAGFENKEAKKYFWDKSNWASSDNFSLLPKTTYRVNISLDSE